MRTKIFLAGLAALSLVACGCDSMGANTKKGAGIGGLVGAVAGGVIGHQSGHGVEGALIGGATGAVAGGVIGKGIDDQEAQASEAPAQDPSAAPVSKAEASSSNPSAPAYLSIVTIAKMAEDGTPEAVIIDEIKATGSVYDLDDATVTYLKQKGVSDAVIEAMKATKK